MILNHDYFNNYLVGLHDYLEKNTFISRSKSNRSFKLYSIIKYFNIKDKYVLLINDIEFDV